MKDAPLYTTATRRAYVRSKLHIYKVDEKAGWSQRDIAWDVKLHFDLEKPPSPTTIKNDLHQIELAEATGTRDITDADLDLLDPERFPEWRAKMFVAPGTNEPYETPEHQHAWFWLVVALALKLPLPDWVETWFMNQDPAFEALEFNTWVEQKDRLMSLMLLAPPRHGKSDLLAHTCIWLICRNPNIRIIWSGGSLPISKLTTAWVRGELEANEELIGKYGPFESPDSWSNEAFTVATRTVRSRAPTMVALGKGSTVLSRDADLIVLDDFVDLRASLSPTTIENDVLWVKSQLMTRREPWTPLLGIGSHQPSPHGDAYSFMAEDKNTSVVFVEIKAHDYTKCLPLDEHEEPDRHGEWCLLWSSLRPWWYLENMKNDMGDIMFEVCYNQDAAQGKIAYFRPEVLRGRWITPVMDDDMKRYSNPDLRYDKPGIQDHSRSWGQIPNCCTRKDSVIVVIGFDPAASESKGAAEAALAVRGACRYCGRRYRIDYWKGRQTPEKHPGTILKYVRMYRPLRVRIEINAYQKALAKDKELTDAQSTDRFIIDEWRTDEKKWDPDMGIPLMSRHMEAGKESMPAATPLDQQRGEEIVRQYLRWPQRPNDMVMADWLAELSLVELLDELLNAVPDWMVDPATIPTALLEQTVTINLADIDDRAGNILP
jgi:hypothetical protein